MKINNKMILTLLVIFIAAVSLSCVSAEDNVTDNVAADNNVAAVSIDDVNDISPTTNIEIQDGANATTIQNYIDGASEGATITFAENGQYTLGENEQINIDKALNLVGNNATFNIRNGFYVSGDSISGTTFTGFNFVIPNETVGTNTAWNGRAIDIRGGENITITDCSFVNGHSGIYIRGSIGDILIANCTFSGKTNTSSIGTKNEAGTKCINLMGGEGITIENNTFTGDALDAISIASNSRDILVKNNYIADVWYGIFYGGGLENISTINNTFYQNKVYSVGLVKAAQTSYIYNNKFILGEVNPVTNNTAAIYLEQGNTAHGAATKIGDVYIKNNTFSIANDTTLDGKTLYAVEVVSAGGSLKTNGAFQVLNNTYDDGIDRFVFVEDSWNYDNGDVNIGQYTSSTEITFPASEVNLTSGSLMNIQLTAEGFVLANQLITLTINGNTTTYTTDKMGIIQFENNLPAGNYTITANYAGNTVNGYKYTASTAQIKLQSVGANATIISEDITKYYKNGTQYQIKLVDGAGNPLANKEVSFNVIGKDYPVTTDANGIATLAINLNPGKYTVSAEYNGVKVTNTVNVLATVEGKNITKYYKNGTQYSATFLNGEGKALANTDVEFNIIGKLYTIKTDANGVATLPINLNPGNYTITATNPTNGEMYSNNIEVLPTILCSDLTKKYGSATTYDVEIVDGQGNPCAGVDVEFNIIGKIYTLPTDANGVAKLPINLIPGSYIVTAKDPNNGLYVSKTVTVTA